MIKRGPVDVIVVAGGIPRFDGSVKWSTWAYRIALNTAITQWRRKSRMPEQPETTETHWVDPEEAEQLEDLYRAIAQLNDMEKALIHLYLDEVSYAEIAAIIGISENNVGVKLNRIKTKLKTLLRHAATT